jgi:glycosyltransferase involved in cell wall biosynthesis
LDVKREEVKTIAAFYYRMNNGGIERVNARLIDIWLGMGYKVVLLTEQPAHPDDYIPEGKVARVVLPPYDGGDSVSPRTRALSAAIDAYGIDVVVYHAWVNRRILWDVMAIKSKGASFVAHTHGTPALVMMWSRQLHEEMTHVYRLTDAVIALSRVDRLYWSSFCNNVKFVSNPVCFDAEDVEPSTTDGAGLLWVGRLESAQKRHMDLIPIMAEVVRRRSDATLTIVGTAKTRREYDRFLDAIAERELERNVITAGYQTDIYPYYKKASIFLSTSSYEGFPTTLVESKAFGVPCVTYELPYLEMHRDGEGMVKTPFGDTKKIAEEIIALLDDDEKRREMGRAARKSLDRYTDVDHAMVWKEIIESVIPGSPGPAPVEPDDETRRILWYTQAFYEDIAMDALAQKNKSLARKFDNMNRRAERLRSDHKDLERKYNRMRNSFSWRIGRAATKIPRAIRRLFRRRRAGPE